MIAPTFVRVQMVLVLALAVTAQPATADELSNRAFQIRYDASGIGSLYLPMRLARIALAGLPPEEGEAAKRACAVHAR